MLQHQQVAHFEPLAMLFREYQGVLAWKSQDFVQLWRLLWDWMLRTLTMHFDV